MKRILTLALIALSAIAVYAAQPSLANRRTASYYFAYPYPELPLPTLSPSPEGYEPFHMEHYGRHGSRWHIGEWVYKEPIDLLRPAERNGKLTQRGKELLDQLRQIELESRGHDGELTPLGARQHRGIAKRMTANFPEIFGAEGARIDAKSTDVVRCILSMDNELQEFAAFNPSAQITSDASKSTVRYLNFDDPVANKINDVAHKKYITPLDKAFKPGFDNFALQLVNDPQFVADSIKSKKLFNSLFRILSNTQSHDDQTPFFDIFTDEQLQGKWNINNATWYVRYGNSDVNECSGPQRQRYLMRNWIESADTSLMRKTPGANMRFGHDVVVYPMVMLMNLDSLGRHTTSLDGINDFVRNYDIVPMAANIQMVFYRPKGQSYTVDDVLVKVLLNEREVTLPATPVSGPYYKWTDVRKAFLNSIGEDGGYFPAPEPY